MLYITLSCVVFPFPKFDRFPPLNLRQHVLKNQKRRLVGKGMRKGMYGGAAQLTAVPSHLGSAQLRLKIMSSATEKRGFLSG